MIKIRYPKKDAVKKLRKLYQERKKKAKPSKELGELMKNLPKKSPKLTQKSRELLAQSAVSAIRSRSSNDSPRIAPVMEVFLVLHDGPIGSSIVGIYSTFEKAQERQKQFNGEFTHAWDQATISKKEVY